MKSLDLLMKELKLKICIILILRKKKRFKDVNFSVKKGESIGIMGRSGSGKTTLINILLGFLKAT